MATARIFRINYKSDFILTLHSDAGWMTPFCIKFWTGAPSQAYYASFDGTDYTNCAAGEDPKDLTVQFDDHGLPIGDLKFQVAYHFTVADFPNDTEDEVINQANITTEIDGQTYQVMLDFNGETAPEIEFSLPAYANEAQRIENEQTRIANEESRVANEEQRVENEQARVEEYADLKADAVAATAAANDAAALANQKAQLAQQKAGLADDAATLATQKAGLADDAATLATQKAGLANDAAALATQKAGLAGDAATLATQKAGLANDAAALANQKAQYASDQGDYAKAQGDYAKAQAGVIPVDVTRSQTDATFVNGDHNPLFYLRQANSSLAGLLTAAGYTKLNDMPSAQEVNAGLAYDVSVLHPTSGVSGGSTYASLSAALAVIPQNKRKGGMTVKFVLSSDNKYVQKRLMHPLDNASTAAADFMNEDNWQGVDDEPTAGSKNLVESGGVKIALDAIDVEVNGQEQNYDKNKKLYTGVESNEVGAGVSDFISYVQGNDVVWIWGETSYPTYHLCFYDTNKEYISDAYWAANDISGQKTILSSDIERYAPNAKFLRATFIIGNNSVKVETGNITWIPEESIDGHSQRINALERSVENIDTAVEGLQRDCVALDEELDDLNIDVDLIKTGGIQNYLSGKILNQDNSLSDDTNTGVTDYVPYTTGNAVSWRWAQTGKVDNYRILFYDSNKNYITDAYWASNNRSGERVLSSSEIQQYAENAAFLRADFKLNDSTANIKVGDSTVWTPHEAADGINLLRSDLNDLCDEVDTLSERVDDLEEKTANTVSNLNSFKNSAIDSIAMKIGGAASNKSKNRYFCILHQSDIHGDATRFRRMIEFANTLDNVNAIIETGDFQRSQWAESNGGFDNTYVALYQTSNVPILPVIGNHDVGNHHQIYTDPANTNAAVGAKYITPYMTAIGAVQGGTDVGYYYRDFSDFKIRVIVLNEYETPRVQNSGGTELKYSIWSRYLSQAQANWLVTTLNAVEEDWSVIICMHQLIDVFDKYNDEFKCAVNYSNADVTNFQGSIIQDIVDAYISRGTLTKSYHYNSADISEVPDVDVSADFTSANGEFICYLNGHTHNDGMGQSSIATNKQVNLNVTTGNSSMVNQAIYDDLYRDNNDLSQDAFNMIAFDTDKKQIRVLRIGANVSADMKRRDYACFSYAQE